jgi:hypothetical protein
MITPSRKSPQLLALNVNYPLLWNTLLKSDMIKKYN